MTHPHQTVAGQPGPRLSVTRSGDCLIQDLVVLTSWAMPQRASVPQWDSGILGAESLPAFGV